MRQACRTSAARRARSTGRRAAITSRISAMYCRRYLYETGYDGNRDQEPDLREPALATTTFNAAWQQSGHTGTSPCLTRTDTYDKFADDYGGQEYLPTPELPTVLLQPGDAGNSSTSTFQLQRRSLAIHCWRQFRANNQPRNDQEGLARVDLDPGTAQHGCTVLCDKYRRHYIEQCFAGNWRFERMSRT